MNRARDFINKKKVRKTLDLIIFVTAVVSLVLLILKMSAVLPDLDATLVVLVMMSIIILINGLKLYAGNAPQAGFQLVLFILFIVIFGFLAGLIKNTLFGV